MGNPLRGNLRILLEAVEGRRAEVRIEMTNWRRGITRRWGAPAFVGALLVATLLPGAIGAAAARRPRVVPLPDGFQPEGIATRGPRFFFVGSIPTGAIYKGNLKTGRGSIFIPAQEGRSAIGLSLRAGMLFVAGGQTGQAFVYNAASGDEVGAFQLTTEEARFINDVKATETAAYFTDSANQVIYKVPIEGRRDVGTPETIPITGDLVYTEGFNANGIDATPDGEWLIIVQSNTGLLFRVDPDTGESTEIDLGGDTVANGDGILLDGDRRLWVLQNQDNLLTRVRLAADLTSGEVGRRFRHRRFDVPTTLMRSRDFLAIVNARFRDGIAGVGRLLGDADPPPSLRRSCRRPRCARHGATCEVPGRRIRSADRRTE